MQHGHSLFELLTVMAIIAILLAIAYPSYQHHLIHTHRHQAQIQLMEIANQLENYHDANHTYQDAPLDNLLINSYYDFQLLNVSDTYYLIKAFPKDNQTRDECGAIWVDQLGNRGGEAVDFCW